MADEIRSSSPPILPPRGQAGRPSTSIQHDTQIANGGVAAAAAARAAARHANGGAANAGVPASTMATTQPTPDAATTGPGRRKGQRNSDEMLYWNAARDKALITVVKGGNGTLSAKDVAGKLRDHEAFADDADLLRGGKGTEKIRIRVKKLNKIAREAGYPELVLRRAEFVRTGYNPASTLHEVFGEVGAGDYEDVQHDEEFEDNEEDFEDDDRPTLTGGNL